MDFRILGPLQVVVGGRPLRLDARKPRALLAILLLHENELVASDRLIEELWGGHPPATSAKVLQTYVSQLRRVLGDGRLLTRTPGYELRLEPGQLDLHHFERLAAEARVADAATTARKLREALALWRGPPLADFAYEPFAQTHIARLGELRLGILEQRIDADLALGRHANLVGEVEALVVEHPLRERLAASSFSRSTALDGRPRRSRRTGRRAGLSWRSSESSQVTSWSASNGRSSGMTPNSTSRPWLPRPLASDRRPTSR